MNAKILWTDDEIDLLKPHILFLNSKGYDVIPAMSGMEAIEILKNQIVDIVFLDETAVGQHDVAEVAGGVGADHLSAETLLVIIGYQAAVVNMSMGEDDVIYFLRFDHRVAVRCIGLKAFALEHAAVEQYFLSVVGDYQVLAAGDFLRCTNEFDSHGRT